MASTCAPNVRGGACIRHTDGGSQDRAVIGHEPRDTIGRTAPAHDRACAGLSIFIVLVIVVRFIRAFKCRKRRRSVWLQKPQEFVRSQWTLNPRWRHPRELWICAPLSRLTDTCAQKHPSHDCSFCVRELEEQPRMGSINEQLLLCVWGGNACERQVTCASSRAWIRRQRW